MGPNYELFYGLEVAHVTICFLIGITVNLLLGRYLHYEKIVTNLFELVTTYSDHKPISAVNHTTSKNAEKLKKDTDI